MKNNTLYYSVFQWKLRHPNKKIKLNKQKMERKIILSLFVKNDFLCENTNISIIYYM